jgi:hypothetical protein
MPINNGVILRETTDKDGATVTARVYYDSSVAASSAQPLINGPRGFCLDLTNVSGRNCNVTVAGQVFKVGQGDPVTTGQGHSLTAAEMAGFGYTTRGSVDSLTIG